VHYPLTATNSLALSNVKRSLETSILRRLFAKLRLVEDSAPHALPNRYRFPRHHRDQCLPSLSRSAACRLDRDLRPNLSRSPPQRVHPFHPKGITILTTSRPSSRAQSRGLSDCARAVLFKSSATCTKPRSLQKDTKSGLVVMRHEDSKRLKALCDWFGWQVIDGGMPGAED
jgi:hypothetical protein